MARNATKSVAATSAATTSVKWSLADVARKYIEMARDSFEDKKAKFVKEVEANPAYAIRWAEGMMQEQAEFECWLMVEKMFGLIGTDIGSMIRKKIPQNPAPSTRAALNSSTGNEAKKLR